MIKRIKIGLFLIILLGLAIVFFKFFIQRIEINNLKKERGHLLNEIAILKMRLKFSQRERIEKKNLKPKINYSQKSIHISSESCKKCFENYHMEVELKDQDGGWIFRDDDIFDQKEGELILTEKFWEELGRSDFRQNFSQKQKIIRPKRLKNRLSACLEPNYTRIEYAYSPMGFRTFGIELNFSIYSSILFNHSFSSNSIVAGVGIDLRF